MWFGSRVALALHAALWPKSCWNMTRSGFIGFRDEIMEPFFHFGSAFLCWSRPTSVHQTKIKCLRGVYWVSTVCVVYAARTKTRLTPFISLTPTSCAIRRAAQHKAVSVEKRSNHVTASSVQREAQLLRQAYAASHTTVDALGASKSLLPATSLASWAWC